MSRDFCRKVWGLICEEAGEVPDRGDKPAGGDRPVTELTLLDAASMFGSTVDLAEGHPSGHALRVAFIVQEVGIGLDLNPSDMLEATLAALVHDTGLLSITHELSDLSTTPEPELLATHALDAVEELAGHVRTGNIKNLSELFIRHAEQGALEISALPFPEGVAQLVGGHHERWDGHGYPRGLRGEGIPLLHRIVIAADCLETAIAGAGERGYSPEFVRAEAMKLSGRQIDPEVARTLTGIAQNVRFWGTFTGAQVGRALAGRLPADRLSLTYGEFARLLYRLVSLVDGKSPYRRGHSWNVARTCHRIGLELGMPEEVACSLGLAGLVHDLGKAGVSNQILDKPKWLTGPEYEAAKKHILFTDRILALGCGVFDEIREWILHHHERLDGSGYPNRMKGDQLSPQVRILATADVYDALISDRPYRKGLDPDAAVRFMEGKVNRYFDPEVLGALGAVVRETPPPVAPGDGSSTGRSAS